MYQKKFMKQAISEAQKNLSIFDGGPFGSVIVKNDKIIASGHNQVLKDNDPTAHGEIVAIRKACAKLHSYDLSNCELYTNAYPCPMCLSAIIWSNIKICYYGNTAQDADEIGFRDDYMYDFIQKNCKNHEILHLEQHDRIDTIKTFQQFNQNQNKTIY